METFAGGCPLKMLDMEHYCSTVVGTFIYQFTCLWFNIKVLFAVYSTCSTRRKITYFLPGGEFLHQAKLKWNFDHFQTARLNKIKKIFIFHFPYSINPWRKTFTPMISFFPLLIPPESEHLENISSWYLFWSYLPSWKNSHQAMLDTWYIPLLCLTSTHLKNIYLNFFL